METVQKFSDNVNKALDYLDNNKMLNTIISMLLVLYAALAAPKLPKSILSIFNNNIFKIGFMFMIAYLAHKDPAVAIITAIALFVTLQALAADEAVDKLVALVKNDSQDKIVKLLEDTKPAKLDVALSPESNQVLQNAISKAKENAKTAIEAFSNNEPEKGTEAQTKAILQEIKVDCIVKCAELKDMANKTSDVILANEKLNEANIENAKVNLIAKLENAPVDHPVVQAIVDAKQSKDLALQTKDKETVIDAAKKELKVQAIAQLDALSSTNETDPEKLKLIKANIDKNIVIIEAADQEGAKKEEVKQAINNGDMKKVEELLKEIAKCETILLAAINSLALKKEALNAKLKGDNETASANMKEAIIHSSVLTAATEVKKSMDEAKQAPDTQTAQEALLNAAKNQAVVNAATNVNLNLKASEEAKKEGKLDIANEFVKNAVNDLTVINSAAKAKTLALAAEQTPQPEVAQALKQEAEKQDNIVVAAAKAEAHKDAAKNATDIEVAKQNLEEAKKQQVLVSSSIKAEAHKEAALNAQANGDMAKAVAHAQEAVKNDTVASTIIENSQEPKKVALVNAAIKAELAKQNGDTPTAEKQEAIISSIVKSEVLKTVEPEKTNTEEIKAKALINADILRNIAQQVQPTQATELNKEAAKQEIKAVSLVKAEAHKAAAEVAETPEEAKAHAKEAEKQEVKVLSIMKAEAHKEATLQAQTEEQAKAHAKEAEKQDIRAETLIKAEKLKSSQNEQDVKTAETIEKKVVAEVKAEMHDKNAIKAEIKNDLEKAEKHREMARKYRQKIHGYDSSLRYASYYVSDDEDYNDSYLISESIKKYSNGVKHQLIKQEAPLKHDMNYDILGNYNTENFASF